MKLDVINVSTLVGVVASFISTFLAWGYIRAGRMLGMLQVRNEGVWQPIGQALTVVCCMGLRSGRAHTGHAAEEESFGGFYVCSRSQRCAAGQE